MREQKSTVGEKISVTVVKHMPYGLLVRTPYGERGTIEKDYFRVRPGRWNLPDVGAAIQGVVLAISWGEWVRIGLTPGKYPKNE